MDCDVVVVGGASAGLQVALTLGRMRLRVLVIDAGHPSNARSHAIGGLLGAHDMAPAALLKTGRAQLAELPSVQVVRGEVARVDSDRTVTLTDGTVQRPAAVVLATGLDYGYPADIPGVSELWGTSVIHCPFCHGWESRDQRIGLFYEDPDHAAHMAAMLSRLSDDVMHFDQVAAVRAEGSVLRSVVLPDGTEVERDVLFVAAPPVPRDASFAALNLERTEGTSLLAIDDWGRTSAPGIYAAGDLVTTAPAVVQALASAQRAAVGAMRDLSPVAVR